IEGSDLGRKEMESTDFDMVREAASRRNFEVGEEVTFDTGETAVVEAVSGRGQPYQPIYIHLRFPDRDEPVMFSQNDLRRRVVGSLAHAAIDDDDPAWADLAKALSGPSKRPSNVLPRSHEM